LGTKNPQLEREIITEYSHGRQLGQTGDAIAASRAKVHHSWIRVPWPSRGLPMALHSLIVAGRAAAAFGAWLVASAAALGDEPRARSLTPPLSIFREQIRPDVGMLPVPIGSSRAQLERGDRVFHGEIAGGRCSQCHGWDARGTPVGNDLTTGMYIWADGTVGGIKRVLEHNMAIAPGMDGELKGVDVEAVAAYVWALGRQK